MTDLCQPIRSTERPLLSNQIQSVILWSDIIKESVNPPISSLLTVSWTVKGCCLTGGVSTFSLQ